MTAAVVIDPDPAENPRPTAANPRWPRRIADWLLGRSPGQQLFWPAFVLITGCALIRQRSLFGTARYPWGDSAVNTLLAIRAEHFQQLVGNYSRVGFHHPGPFFLYLLGAGEVLFGTVLHVAPAPYNAQLLGISVYVAVFFGLSVASLCRLTGSRGAALIALGLSFIFLGHVAIFGADWFPFLYMSAFLLFTVSAAGLLAGRSSELPLYVLSAGALVHGHVSFLLFTGVTSVAVALGWWRVHRRAVRAELAGHRRALIGAAVIAAVLALPMLLDLILHFPGQWSRYADYALHGTRRHRTIGDVLSFVEQYWNAVGFWLPLIGLAAAAAVALTWTESNPVRRRAFGSLYLIVGLQTLLTCYYVLRGVDELNPRRTYGYVGYFYETVPLVLVIAAGAQLWIRLREFRTWRTGDRRVPLNRLRLALVLVCAGLVAFGGTRPNLDASRREAGVNAAYPVVARTLRSDADRQGRPIAFVHDQEVSWVYAAGVAVQLQRSGVPWCVYRPDAVLVNVYTPTFVCHGDRARWLVHFSRTRPRRSIRVIWHGRLVNRIVWVYTQN